MSKINDIIISNFKFFSKEEKIHLGGKHLLLYGENGSGKSSIFWGLYTLLEASFKNASETKKYFLPLSKNEESLVNIYAPIMQEVSSKTEHYNSYIKVLDDNSNSFELSLLEDHICGDSNTQECRKASDFINYQSIFKFQDFRNSETPNLYNIFLYSILPYVTFSSITLNEHTDEEIVLANASQMWSEYQKGPSSISFGKKIREYKQTQNYQDFCKFEKHFNSEFEKLLDFINSHAKKRLKALGYDIDFILTYEKPNHTIKKCYKDKSPFLKFDCTLFKIELKITNYNGESVNIKKPHVFLNEAKLSALATAIRLSILDYRISKTAAPNALKILVLDDLMISLDMSNREPLLDLLLKEYSNKYQILFFVHDENLYSFVDYKIKQHKQDVLWVRKEMYVGEDNTTKHEMPVVIDGECDSYVKAQKYYLARDYVSASLYIRKSLEEFVTNYLPEEYCRNADGKFIELNKLWDRLLRYTNSIPPRIDNMFKQSKLMVLNPSAHYQKTSFPIYKRELLKAFELIDELKKLNIQVKILLVDKDSKLIFKHPSTNYSFEFQLTQDMIRGKNEDPSCKIITWQYNGVDFYSFQAGIAHGTPPSVSETKLSRLIDNLMKISVLSITKELFLSNTYIEKGTLKEAIE